ncbi:hypothetical protein H072_866 [Dactylellina haptotyla CBS 200.50]|uniref:Mitochondrial division protein 1 n=1 Tax=Dactylellina haptotyla (strain CBS 200.50) TaxID=1284197 RepID=S8AQ69_DACHA|nr:hypothetical protein H072_866 [Dactylellina haptotyla CBS 200.50]
MVKFGLTSWLFIQAVSAMAIAEPIPQDKELYARFKGLKYVKYDGPRYYPTEEEKAAFLSGNGTWERPDEIPIIHLDGPTFLDLSGGDDGNSTALVKRGGAHYAQSWTGTGCGGDPVVRATAFGCGAYCISHYTTSHSMSLWMEKGGNPKPTVSTFTGINCQGNKQSMGISGGTYSCTNTQTGGFNSFFAYFNYGVSVAASIIAVVQIATSVAKICDQYLLEVKNARNDVEEIKHQSEVILKTLDNTQSLLEGPHKAKFCASRELGSALSECRVELDELRKKLEEDFTVQKAQKDKKGASKILNRFGKRDFKWPLTKKDVNGIVRKLDKIQESIQGALQIDQVKIVLSVEQEAILAKVPIAEGATFGSFQDENEPECLPDTRTELLANIQKWISDPRDKHIFWLCGMAGTGKSTISRTVARTLRGNRQLGASFFKRGKTNRGDASRFFGTIVSDLRLHIPELGPEISQAVEIDPDIGRKALREQFENLMLGPLRRLGPISTSILPTVIVIDALDECEGDTTVKLLLKFLSQCRELDIDLRIFITSRPETPINLGFEMLSAGYEDLILHDIQESTIRHDISVFIKHEFANIRVERRREVGGDWPGEETIQNLIGIAVPLFISAATMCRFVADKKFPAQSRLDAILKLQNASFASKLDKTYLPIFNQMIIDADNKEVEVIAEFKQIVGTIILLESPLSLLSLSQLLDKTEVQLLCTLEPLQSVINVPDSTNAHLPIQTFHLSFKDFLVDDANRSRWFWIATKQTHKRLGLKCISLLSKNLKKDICCLKAPGTSRKNISLDMIEQKITPAIQYACRYWTHHLGRGGDSIDLKDLDEVHAFLCSHLLHWFEVASILGASAQIIYFIKDLESISQMFETAKLSELICDTKRFVQSNIAMIEEAPLQLYSSALLFIPEHSLIKNMYSHEKPNWIEKSTNHESWGPIIQTIEGHEEFLTFLGFSPDGKQLVSGFDDGIIKLWDIISGSLLQTLNSYSHSRSYRVLSISFSLDCRTLASGFVDGTIKLWDLASGAAQTLNLHINELYVLKFTLDIKYVVSGKSCGSLQVWDTTSGKLIRTLEGHSCFVTSLSFNLDGEYLASGSWDKTVRVWKMTTGQMIHTFKGHTGWIQSVEFSYSGGYIASCSEDGIVLLWNADSGKILRRLSIIREMPQKLTFKPGDGQIAVGVDPSRVILWELSSGETKVLETDDYSSRIPSLAYSPDGCLLASGSPDGAIKLWDVASELRRMATLTVDMKPESPSSSESSLELDTSRGEHIITTEVLFVLFSPDGTQLATASRPSLVKLWDPVSWRLLRTLEANGQVKYLVFSRDGGQLALGSYNNTDHETITIWDSKSGALLHKLAEDSVCTRFLTYSPSGQLASVSGSEDRSGEIPVRLWDTTSGELLKILGTCTADRPYLTFPSDNELVILSSDRVDTWDTLSGQRMKSTGLGMLDGDAVSLACLPDGRQYIFTKKPPAMWDATSGLKMRQFSEHDRIWSIFPSYDCRYVEINGEKIPIQLSEDTDSPDFCHLPISVRGRWICYDEVPVLWLPHQDRPSYYDDTVSYLDELGNLDYSIVTEVLFGAEKRQSLKLALSTAQFTWVPELPRSVTDFCRNVTSPGSCWQAGKSGFYSSEGITRGENFVRNINFTGYFVEDDVIFGDASLKLKFGVAEKWYLRPTLGLGLDTYGFNKDQNYSSFLNASQQQGKIPGLVSSFYNLIDPSEGSSGEIIIGGVDSEKFYGNFEILNESNGQGEMKAPNITIHSPQETKDFDMSGHGAAIRFVEMPFILVPPAIYDSIMNVVGARQTETNSVGFLPCNSSIPAEYSIDFIFPKVTIKVPFSQLLAPRGKFARTVSDQYNIDTSDDFCPLMLLKIDNYLPPVPDKWSFVLGGPFLRNAYFVLSLEGNFTAVAAAKPNVTTQNIVELGGYNGTPLDTIQGSQISPSTARLPVPTPTAQPKPDPANRPPIGTIVGCSVGGVVILLAGIVLAVFFKRRRRNEIPPSIPLPETPMSIHSHELNPNPRPLHELTASTNNEQAISSVLATSELPGDIASELEANAHVIRARR